MRVIGGLLLLLLLLGACGQASTGGAVSLRPGAASVGPTDVAGSGSGNRGEEPVGDGAAMGMCAAEAPDCNDMIVGAEAPDDDCTVSSDGVQEETSCPGSAGAAGGGSPAFEGTGEILCEGGKPTTAAPPGTDCTVPEPPAGREVRPAPDGLDDVHAVGWDRFTARGRRLTVHWFSGVAPCSVLHSVRVREGAKRIVVTLREGSASNGGACIAMAESVKTTVTLDRPLGTRKVVDGADG